MLISKRNCLKLWVLALLIAFARTGQADIAYLRYSEGFWQVWVTDNSGETHRQLTHDPIDKTRVSWSPDGKELLCNRNDGLLVRVDIENVEQTLLKLPIEGMLDAQWSPNGEWIAFSKASAQSVDNNDLWVIRTSGEAQAKLTNQPGMEHSPAWKRDGSALTFSAGEAQKNFEIWSIVLAKKSTTQLTVGTAFSVDPSYSPEGHIAYAADNIGNYDIWILEAGVDLPRQLTKDPSYDAQPTWSPDGKHIAFYSRRDGNKRIWVMDANGKNPRPITPEQAMSRYPEWSR